MRALVTYVTNERENVSLKRPQGLAAAVLALPQVCTLPKFKQTPDGHSCVFGREFLQAGDLGLLGLDLIGLFFQAVGFFVGNGVFAVRFVGGELVFDVP
jgi:hypothetical protein